MQSSPSPHRQRRRSLCGCTSALVHFIKWFKFRLSDVRENMKELVAEWNRQTSKGNCQRQLPSFRRDNFEKQARTIAAKQVSFWHKADGKEVICYSFGDSLPLALANTYYINKGDWTNILQEAHCAKAYMTKASTIPPEAALTIPNDDGAATYGAAFATTSTSHRKSSSVRSTSAYSSARRTLVVYIIVFSLNTLFRKGVLVRIDISIETKHSLRCSDLQRAIGSFPSCARHLPTRAHQRTFVICISSRFARWKSTLSTWKHFSGGAFMSNRWQHKHETLFVIVRTSTGQRKHISMYSRSTY